MTCVLLIAFFLLAGATQPALAQARAGAPAPAACGGRDLAAEFRQQEPGKYEAALTRARATFPNLDGRFWLIERPGTPASMLFGTMHVADRRATIPAELAMALVDARVVAVELEDALVSGPKKNVLAARMLAAAIDVSANSLGPLSPDDRAFVEHHLELRGFPREAVGAFRPWVLFLMLSWSACELQQQATSPNQILDARILADRGSGTTVTSLETADEQIQALSGLPDELVLRSMVPTLRSSAANDDLFATVIALYQKGQVGAAMDIAIARGVATEADRTAALELVRLLKGERDRRMAERALPLLAEGNAVIAVGALHLIGEGGLVQRFREAGYTLTRLD